MIFADNIMGIRGLQSYAEQQPNVFYPVDLKHEAEKHRKKVRSFKKKKYKKIRFVAKLT